MSDLTDITPFIHKEFASCGGRGVIEIPVGNFAATGNLLALSKDNRIKLRGQGQHVTKIVSEADAPLITSNGIRGAMCSGLEIEGITFEGGMSLHPCLKLQGMQRAKYKAVTFQNFTIGACHLSMNWDSRFEDCEVFRCGKPGNSAVFVGPMASTGGPISEFRSNCITFKTCRFEDNAGHSLYVGQASDKILITDNCKFHGSIGQPNKFAHVVLDNCQQCSVIGSNFTVCGTSPLWLRVTRNCSIIGNQFNAIQRTPGVKLEGTAYTDLVGNQYPDGQLYVESGMCSFTKAYE